MSEGCYYWYCSKCKKEVPSSEVTYAERHEACGSEVDFLPVAWPEDDDIAMPKFWRLVLVGIVGGLIAVSAAVMLR